MKDEFCLYYYFLKRSDYFILTMLILFHINNKVRKFFLKKSLCD